MEEFAVLGSKRINDACMAVAKIEDRLSMLTDLLSMRALNRFPNPHAGYNGVALEIPGGGCEWEVLEPTGDSSCIAHVTLQVESVEKATEALREYGHEPFGSRSHGSYKKVFIHPHDSGGVLFQLGCPASVLKELRCFEEHYFLVDVRRQLDRRFVCRSGRFRSA